MYFDHNLSIIFLKVASLLICYKNKKHFSDQGYLQLTYTIITKTGSFESWYYVLTLKIASVKTSGKL